MKICGYDVKKIYSNDKQSTIIYKGAKPGTDHYSVIIKKHPHSKWQMHAYKDIEDAYARLPAEPRHNPKLIQHDFDKDGAIIYVYAEAEGVNLKQHLLKRKLNITQKLTLANNVLSSLEELHSANIIHGNICPENVIVSKRTRIAYLIDLGASFLSDNKEETRFEKSYKDSSFFKVNTLFCAPEILSNLKEIGPHSDLFSFGVLLYEMFTGKLPNFEILDAATMDSNIPESVSKLILKCINGSPTKRYHTIAALKKDLGESLSENTDNETNSINISHTINSTEFHKECRSSEIDVLTEVYRRASVGSSELVFIEGLPHSGRQSLIDAFISTTTKVRYQNILLDEEMTLNSTKQIALFVNVISSITSGLTQTESDVLKLRIKQSGFKGGQLLLANPAFSCFFSASAEKNDETRLIEELVEYVALISDEEWPLVISFQFTERLSEALTSLIDKIYTNHNKMNVVLLLSYNEAALGPESYLNLLLRTTCTHRSKRSAVQTHIEFHPIHVDVITGILEDVFSPSKPSLGSLAEIIYNNTKGYPNQVGQCLDKLVSNKRIHFDQTDNQWNWDNKKIDDELRKAAQELVYTEVKEQVSGSEIDIINILACSGIPVELSDINKFRINDNAPYIEASLSGLLLNQIINKKQKDGLIKFQLKSALFSEQVRAELDTIYIKNIHETILSKLFEKTNLITPENTVLVADQLYINQGREFCPKLEYIRIATLAASKADARKDRTRTNRHLSNAYSLLTLTEWENEHGLSFNLLIMHLKTLLSAGEFTSFEKVIKDIPSNEISIEEESKIIELVVKSYKTQGLHSEAIAVGRIHLKKLGYTLPKHAYIVHTVILFAALYLRLLIKPFDKLRRLPSAKDEKTKTIMQLSEKLATAAYTADPDLLPVISLKGALYSLKHGTTPETTQFLMIGGLILLIGAKSQKQAHKFKEYAFELAKKFPESKNWMDGVLGLYYHGMIRPWKDSYLECEKDLTVVFKNTVIQKDFETAAFANSLYFAGCMGRGHEAVSLEKEFDVTFPQVKMFKQANQEHLHRLMWQMVRNISTPCKNPTVLKGDVYDEDQYRDFHESQQDKTVTFSYYYVKMMLCNIFNDYEGANRNFKKGKRIIKGAFGLPIITLFYMGNSLSTVAMTDFSSTIARIISLIKILPNKFRFKHYSRNNKENFEHLNLLHRAEFYTLIPFDLGTRTAKLLYSQAKDVAAKRERFNDVALIIERQMAYLYKFNDAEEHQKELAKNAIDYYRRAGYHTKALKMERDYGLDEVKKKVVGQKIDLTLLQSVFKNISNQNKTASHLEDSIVSEIARLVSADTCVLILDDTQGNYRARSLYQLSSGGVSRPKTNYTDFSRSSAAVIKRTLNERRTKTFIGRDEIGALQDSYLSKHSHISSVAAIPLINSEKYLLGVIYLEHFNDSCLDIDTIELLECTSYFVVNLLESAIVRESKKQADTETKYARDHLAKVCHEMNTPTNTIVLALKSLVKWLRKSGLPEDNEFFNRAQLAARQLMRISKDTIDYEKIKDKSLPLHDSHFSLRDVILAAFESNRLTLAFADKNVELRFPKMGNIHNNYNNDPLRILQILNNLIGNAVKFTNKGYIACDLNIVTTTDTEDVIEFVITNTCPKIPEDILPKIFSEYTQGDASSTREYGGFGLGLAIVKELTHYMGGRVTCSSTDQVTTFSFSLPLNRVSPEDFNPIPLEIEEDTWRSLDCDDLLKDKTIVVVDDANEDRRGLVATLEDMGAVVVDFELPLEAITYIHEHPIDLVLTDIEMPKVDGYGLTREVRRFKGNIHELPILATTGHRLGDIEKKCLDVGMNGHIGKPYMPETIAIKLAKLFSLTIKKRDESKVVVSADVGMPILPGLKHIHLLHPLLQMNDTPYRLTMNLMDYFEEQRFYITEIREAFEAGKYEKARVHAHTLKNTYLHIGALSMSDLALTFEKDLSEYIDNNTQHLDRQLIEELCLGNVQIFEDVKNQINHLKSNNWNFSPLLIDSATELFTQLKKHFSTRNLRSRKYRLEILEHFNPIDKTMSEQLLLDIKNDDLSAAAITLEALRKRSEEKESADIVVN